ncbi:symmetrical bis(5'-nucleosyl)-tetraphosphatase [Shewanella cyperi]|uniref:bis(5'-nucleosyl)-tetraphosphatase (symmetrical) n=1 Tax=Shewanella cyperi TaxID=2814292 RepID=A0A974XNU6_9GAMM|nr:symmetrical bis(5'-nucleosyl)-tetraphosphatase [Shewanella cyperi]QSX30688.1 symmetrical bis(5'-nucleosyl)-tetraphosphatase [Shewanella cyperi]
MANYFVGDIQGCNQELQSLLAKVDFNPSKDTLWAVGDLVARGPDSLKVLNFFESLDGSARVVLGNHDLHLLAIYNGLKRAKASDKLEKLLASERLPTLIGWLRQQPLMQELPEHKLIMTHAGVPPQWDLPTLRAEAAAVHMALQQEDYFELLAFMYTETPEAWSETLQGKLRLRYCIDALTRMRYLHSDGRLDFKCKTPPEDCKEPDLHPWFELPSRLEDHTLVFGHWAALMGKVDHPLRIALDTGCCWGEHLTLWHLENREKISQKRMK